MYGLGAEYRAQANVWTAFQGNPGLNMSIILIGAPSSDSRDSMDARALRLAVLEPQCLGQWSHSRQQGSEMVV